MKIAFTFPPAAMGRPIDPGKLWTDPRGLTGSEVSCFCYAIGLAALGHEVHWYTNATARAKVGALDVHPYQEWAPEHGDYWDAVVCWMLPDPVMDMQNTSAFRVFNQQCSDFGGCRPGWENSFDLFCPLSETHALQMQPQTHFSTERYRVMYNGVDLEAFKPGTKIPGRCLWASSHDRGLHHALELWPSVRERFPYAELVVCYDTAGIQAFASRTMPDVPFMKELQRRSIYELEMLKRLQGHGVWLKGSVSREEMQREMAQAEVLLYPCEPVRMTETFGNTVLEAMAAGCVPVLGFADAFAELWAGRGVPGVAAPVSANKEAYKSVLLDVLANPAPYAHEAQKGAHDFAWPDLIRKFERTLATRGAEGLDRVRWPEGLAVASAPAEVSDPAYVRYQPHPEWLRMQAA